MSAAPTTEVEQAIVACALDYYEGWFEGDASRMRRALHPELVKRSLAEEGTSLHTLSAKEMIEATENGIGLTRDPGVDARDIEINVDHVYGGIATASVTSSVYVDYLQLGRTPEGWKIVNVLWDWVTRPPEFVTVTTGLEIEEGQLTAFEVGEDRIAVAKADGTLYAFDDRCPHRQCSLAEGDLEGTVVTCPCHGSQFDVTTGERLRGPAVRGIRTHAVRQAQGELRIEI